MVLNFDADAAGVKAAKRAIGEVTEMAYQGNIQLRVLNLPDGKDADDYLQSHLAEEYGALLEAAPLWLDWQIQQILKDCNLKQADQFQLGTQAVVKLLSDIANADTRTHYVRHCAEIFSQGDARLVPLLAENLLAQVRRKRRSPGDRQPTLPMQPWSVNSLEEAESALLRIYLHAADYRQAVVDALEERDLQFSFSHHRALWRQLSEFESPTETGAHTMNPQDSSMANWVEASDQSSGANLVSMLRDRCAESSGSINQVLHLLHLEEKTQRDILRAPLVIRAAVACMEKALCEKRYRHFLTLWAETDGADSPERHAYYQQQIYSEKKRIEELEKQRQVDFADLAQIPWVGEFL